MADTGWISDRAKEYLEKGLINEDTKKLIEELVEKGTENSISKAEEMLRMAYYAYNMLESERINKKAFTIFQKMLGEDKILVAKKIIRNAQESYKERREKERYEKRSEKRKKEFKEEKEMHAGMKGMFGQEEEKEPKEAKQLSLEEIEEKLKLAIGEQIEKSIGEKMITPPSAGEVTGETGREDKPAGKAKYCTKCGNELKGYEKFCIKCGKKTKR